MSTEIKPCPFCGKRCMKEQRWPGLSGSCLWYIVCEYCRYSSEQLETESEAIEAHNQLADLRAENERLRNELYKSNLAIINDVIPPSDGDDPEDIGIIIWHKWPGEKPVNDDPIERIALSDEGKIYLTKTSPSKWCKGNSFHWAEIPRPEGG